uniref:Uncharacterized protein n=1 Tax=Nelumbo nucifera TaxID=4432 RepID=A0A822ZZ98_NELNU|nr:TPA_asm: hypothetical protein HUJ06_018093 [Nelumbo nucifera]
MLSDHLNCRAIHEIIDMKKCHQAISQFCEHDQPWWIEGQRTLCSKIPYFLAFQLVRARL